MMSDSFQTLLIEDAITFYQEGIHPHKISAAVELAIETRTLFNVDLKIVTAKGNEHWVRAVGEAEFSNGKCVRIF